MHTHQPSAPHHKIYPPQHRVHFNPEKKANWICTADIGRSANRTQNLRRGTRNSCTCIYVLAILSPVYRRVNRHRNAYPDATGTPHRYKSAPPISSPTDSHGALGIGCLSLGIGVLALGSHGSRHFVYPSTSQNRGSRSSDSFPTSACNCLSW
jgi:hypothetical protein